MSVLKKLEALEQLSDGKSWYTVILANGQSIGMSGRDAALYLKDHKEVADIRIRRLDDGKKQKRLADGRYCPNACRGADISENRGNTGTSMHAERTVETVKGSNMPGA